MDRSFAKHHRLLSSRDYSRVFEQATFKASSRHLLILGCLSTQSHARLGLVMAKKHVAAAVDRNRLKRLSREVFRQRRSGLPAIDMVLLARPGLGQLDNPQVIALLNQLIDGLIKQCNKPAATGEPRTSHVESDRRPT